MDEEKSNVSNTNGNENEAKSNETVDSVTENIAVNNNEMDNKEETNESESNTKKKDDVAQESNTKKKDDDAEESSTKKKDDDAFEEDTSNNVTKNENNPDDKSKEESTTECVKIVEKIMQPDKSTNEDETTENNTVEANAVNDDVVSDTKTEDIKKINDEAAAANINNNNDYKSSIEEKLMIADTKELITNLPTISEIDSTTTLLASADVTITTDNSNVDKENKAKVTASNAESNTSRHIEIVRRRRKPKASDLYIKLEGTHTTHTDTERTIAHRMRSKHVTFDNIHEFRKHYNIDAVPSPSSSQLQADAKADEETSLERVNTLQETLNKKMTNDVVNDVLQGIQSNIPAAETSASVSSRIIEDTKEEKTKIDESKNVNRDPIENRFNRLMELFDSFTKNLENFDNPIIVNSPRKQCIKNDDISPRIHRSRYDKFFNKTENSINDETETSYPSCSYENDNPTVITLADLTACLEANQLTSTSNIACQTSLQQIDNATTTATPPMENVSPNTSQMDFPDFIQKPELLPSEIAIDIENDKAPKKNKDWLLNDVPTLIGEQTEIPRSERSYHTIHIETASSPSSSLLQRPPLYLRLWHVITDFFTAICLCLQVNKDCIFCIGFFVAFVVSASFLTAFFYRTLSVNPPIFYQHDSIPPLEETDNIHREKGMYIL